MNPDSCSYLDLQHDKIKRSFCVSLSDVSRNIPSGAFIHSGMNRNNLPQTGVEVMMSMALVGASFIGVAMGMS